MPRGIDDINVMLFPHTGRGRGRDGNATLPFLRHPIHHGLTVVHFAKFMSQPSVVENTFRNGRFARINMRDDPNIAQTTHSRGNT